MALLFQSHSGKDKDQPSTAARQGGANARANAAPPIPGDIAADEEADFGYFLPPLDAPANYLPSDPVTVTELDALGDIMIDQGPRDPAGADADMAPVLTYWGQFLDHELTARTNAEGAFSNISTAHPPQVAADVETNQKCAHATI